MDFFFFITMSSVLKGELLIFMATAMFDFPGVTVLRYQLFLVFCSICKVPFTSFSSSGCQGTLENEMETRGKPAL